MIVEFGSLGAILTASPDVLRRIIGPDTEVPVFLGRVHAALLYLLHEKLTSGPLLSSSDELMAYLSARLAHERTEQFRTLFLNSGARLLKDESMGEGSVFEAPVYPREVIRRALELGATALILVHNHPSGDPTPSRHDIAITREIVTAAKMFSISVFDHVIVSKGGCVSFREKGLF